MSCGPMRDPYTVHTGPIYYPGGIHVGPTTIQMGLTYYLCGTRVEPMDYSSWPAWDPHIIQVGSTHIIW